MVKHLAGACLVALSLSALAVTPARANEAADSGIPTASSHGLLAQLERFMHQRELDTASLNAGSMVGVMIDWARFEPATGMAGADSLVFQYGGWSEGCATGFKFSLLRKLTLPESAEGNFAQTAGITLLFDTGANTDLAPFKLVSSDLNSIEAFMAAIESSPAFRKLATATPMAVMVESGGIR